MATIAFIGLGVLGAAVAFVLFNKIERRRITMSLDMTLFLVMMPKYNQNAEGQSQKDEKSLIGEMEQVYTNFLYLKANNFFEKLIYGPPRIALEIASQIGGTDIFFYVAVPRYLEGAFEKYVQGVYSRSLIQKVPQDYTIFEPGGVSSGAYLKLENSALLPINTYKNLDKDPLSAITNALSKINANEGAAVQLIIRPADYGEWKGKARKALKNIREGKSLHVATRTGSGDTSDAIFSALEAIATSQSKEQEQKPKEVLVDDQTIQAIESKTQKQLFETNIRIIASAQDIERAEQIVDHLETSFGQFSLASANSFRAVRQKRGNLKKLLYGYSFRNYSNGQQMVLNIEELTSVYHFPTYLTDTPYVKTTKTVEAAAPIDLPDKGLNLIGTVTFRGDTKKVYFSSREDRRRHFYIIGQTGTGKSSLMREMIRQDIENGEGVAVIDPHGELVDHTLANIPPNRINDVVLFEPFDLERPMGLNMLEYDSPEQKDFAVQEMIAIFYKLFPPEIIGPMFEHYMRNAMLALMADRENPGTLVEIPRIFTDDAYMESKLQWVIDPLVRSFWLKEWKQTTGSTKSDMLGYVVSKVGRFVENEMMRNIIGQSHSGFDLAKIMDDKKIFLANLSKGLTGEVNSSLLGLILVSKMQMAAMKRARLLEEERQDFYLYVDEFQNFTTDSITTILSEARKYRLNLILAHQYMPQLTDPIKNAVIGNVGTMGAYRIGADDAEFLEKQFSPEFSRSDLVNLDNFNMIIKMLINNRVSTPFRIVAPMPQKGNPDMIAPIKKISRNKYGRPRELVEMEIIDRSKLGGL
ncbi:MAG: DUF87 domain-containing protein [bacterium]